MDYRFIGWFLNNRPIAHCEKTTVCSRRHHFLLHFSNSVSGIAWFLLLRTHQKNHRWHRRLIRMVVELHVLGPNFMGIFSTHINCLLYMEFLLQIHSLNLKWKNNTSSHTRICYKAFVLHSKHHGPTNDAFFVVRPRRTNAAYFAVEMGECCDCPMKIQRIMQFCVRCRTIAIFR